MRLLFQMIVGAVLVSALFGIIQLFLNFSWIVLACFLVASWSGGWMAIKIFEWIIDNFE